MTICHRDPRRFTAGARLLLRCHRQRHHLDHHAADLGRPKGATMLPPPEGPGIYWLSFVDAEDGHFLGVAIVHASDPITAVQEAWAQECNPGGEVGIMGPFPPDVVAEADMNRLLDRAEAERVGGIE